MLLRRGHLYAGLLMLPWVLLYGITAFLFNHPTAFSDQQSVSFGADALQGTPMEHIPAPREIAEQVVAALRERKPEAKYELAVPDNAKFNREFAFATVKTDQQEISVLVEANGAGGTIRAKALTPAKPIEPAAPFAVGREPNAAPKGKGGGDRPARTGGGEGLKLPETLVDRMKATVPAVLTKSGFPTGDVTITSVPDVTFLMNSDDKLWKVTYNASAGSISGKLADNEPATDPLSTRRFLTRLHMAHGYPSETGSRWFWAVIVDAMAVIMLFWGLSGLFMWWQIKATRRLGTVILLVSLVAATLMGIGMHEQISITGR
ncbi:PepSY domain-containing protein [Zavarzinella formosa]|uniref:PepSY domain-containing protein n=1 Tax=Zavarzinella formosa TaxID=360055 RepID=UPI00037161B3|nr:PepSY domain-containing protein [Zavarzinella formosa]